VAKLLIKTFQLQVYYVI